MAQITELTEAQANALIQKINDETVHGGNKKTEIASLYKYFKNRIDLIEQQIEKCCSSNNGSGGSGSGGIGDNTLDLWANARAFDIVDFSNSSVNSFEEILTIIGSNGGVVQPLIDSKKICISDDISLIPNSAKFLV